MAVRTLSAPSIDAGRVHRGMEVYDNNGTLLGSVAEVWAYVAPYGHLAKSKFGRADYGPVRGTAHLFEGADGYMQVRRSSGMRREGEQDLYIPLNAIGDLAPREWLTLSCSEETCSARFGDPPEAL